MILEILWKFIYFVINVVLGYLFADLLLGVYHWIKDTYFGPFTPIIGRKFIWGSRLHHIRPKYVTQISDYNLVKESSLWTLTWMAPVFFIFGFNSFNATIFTIISINDVVHKYAHLNDGKRPKIATFLQKIGIFQGYNEHHQHHTMPFEINYCPITPYVNVVLEKYNFWRKLEHIIEYLIGVKPRNKEYDFVEDDTYPAGVRFIE